MSLIIDTDIGSDIDDAIAIAYALKRGLDVKLISTVHGPVGIRAKIAKKFTEELGYNIPIAKGYSKPIKQQHIFTTGLEGKGYVEDYPYSGILRIDALAETIYANKEEIDIAAIGPLTNIAKTLEKYPEMENYVANIFIMGNAITTPERYYLNYRAHNLKVDPEAADIVFNSKICKTVITTPICKKNFLTPEEIQRLRIDYISKAGKDWLEHINDNVAYLYDPLVIHHYFDYSITDKKFYGDEDNEVRVTTEVFNGFKHTLLSTLMR